MSTWKTQDDFLNDLEILSNYASPSKLNLSNDQQEQRIKNKEHKSIYDEDEFIGKDLFRPIRGANLCKDLKSPGFNTSLYQNHLKETKAAIREVSKINFSNEYIEKTLTTTDDSCKNELSTNNSNVDFSFKPSEKPVDYIKRKILYDNSQKFSLKNYKRYLF